MPRLSRAAFLATALLLPIASITRADPTSGAKKAIVEGYTKFNAALSKKDITGALAMMTPDFVQTDAAGKQYRLAEMKQMGQEMIAPAKTVGASTKVGKVTLDPTGKKATAAIQNIVKLTVVNPQNNQTAVLVSTEYATDTWVKTEKGWRMQRSKTLKSSQTLDGKPL